MHIGKQTDKPRLMKVITLLSREEKLVILHNQLNLCSKEYPSHVNKVFLMPDLTLQEQKRTRLAELNKAENCYHNQEWENSTERGSFLSYKHTELDHSQE